MHDRAHRGFDLLFRHRPLLQRAIETRTQLARIEGFPPTVALHDHRQLELDRFQRAETLAAGLADATTADGGAVVGNARVDHAGVLVLTERAMHLAVISFPWLVSVSSQPYTGNCWHCLVTFSRTAAMTFSSLGWSSTSQIQFASATQSASL